MSLQKRTRPTIKPFPHRDAISNMLPPPKSKEPSIGKWEVGRKRVKQTAGPMQSQKL